MCFGGESAAPPPPKTVNIPQLQALATGAARQNVTNSLALQSQVFPGLNAAQNAAIGQVGSNVNSPYIFNPIGTPFLANSPLLDSASNYAQNEMNLGYQLPRDVQAQVARQAGARHFQSGLRGSGLANATAADIGLTSLQVGQQRFQNAAALGQFQQAQNEQQQALKNSIDQFNAQFGANVAMNNRTNALAAAGLLTGIGAPKAGLDPGDIASVEVGNVNQQNAYNQQVAAVQAEQENSNNSMWGNIIGNIIGAAGIVLAPATGGASLLATAGAYLNNARSGTPSGRTTFSG